MEWKEKIYIFGGGNNGKELLDFLTEHRKEERIAAFIDNDKEKQAAGIRGLKCLSVNEAIKEGARDADAMVLISPDDSKDIIKNLEKSGFNNLVCANKWLWKNKYYRPHVLKESDYEKAVPFNHYESPYPDIVDVHKKENELFNTDKEILDIDFNIRRQSELIERMKEINLPEWPEDKKPVMKYRYFYNNEWFEKGSADALYYMMRILKPNKIIEVGSGYSTAVMLDVNENYFNNKIQLISIEPDSRRLKSLLRPTDQLCIIEKNLQDISRNFFDKLRENDILFIDSSHVSKMDSDVNYLFFDILPLLSKGVYIHFHDIMYPFIYPPKWIYEGRAYNEAYILRAFLMNNKQYSVQFFGDMLSKKCAELIGELLGCGEGSLWLKKER